MKNLFVSCGGGLCNRLINIINGFYFYEKYDFDKLYIVWRNQIGLSCKFDECFVKQDFEVIDEKIIGYNGELNRFAPKSVYPNEHVHQVLTKKMDNAGEFANVKSMENDGNWMIRGSSFFPEISSEQVLEIIQNKMLKPAPKLLTKINEFQEQNDLRENNFLGVHIRRTDGPPGTPSDQHYISEITRFLWRNKNKKVFLCSDDSAVEEKIHSHFGTRVIIRPKQDQPVSIFPGVLNQVKYDREYFDRANNLGWTNSKDPPEWLNKNFGLPNGSKMMYNIFRGPQTTQEGIVDLFLLSKAEVLMKSVGTYSLFAHLMILARSYGKK